MKQVINATALFLICLMLILSCGCRKTTQSGKALDCSSQAQNDYSVLSEVSSASLPEATEGTPVTSSEPTVSTAQPEVPALLKEEQPPTLPPTPTVTVPSSEKRAVWISYLEFMTILMNKTESQFTASITDYFDRCVSSGLNKVIIQVRSHADAYYASSYFPTSAYFTGVRRNTAPFDPLSIMVKEAHRRQLKIEAWINPYRANRTDMPFAPDDPVEKWLNSDKVYKFHLYGIEYYGFNPGEPEVRQLVINGVVEVLDKYDIDGIHFDDYFYPEITDADDLNTYNKYGQGLSLHDFRIKCVNELVSSVYKEVKARNKTFGISPAGNIDNCVNKNCADVRLWGSCEGYVDYIAPQIYWTYGEGTSPYDVALENWKNVITNPKIKLVVGLAAYRTANSAYPAWSAFSDNLARQVTDARKISNYSGFILFRSEFFFDSARSAERENLKKILQ